MKRSVQFLLAGSLFGILFLASCAKDDPEPTSQTPVFHGHWLIVEHSSASGNTSYYVDIADSTNASYILFSYLNGYHTKVRASVSGSNFTIPTQTVEGNNVSGGGTLTNANQINMNYLVWAGGSNYDTITATLTK